MGGKTHYTCLSFTTIDFLVTLPSVGDGLRSNESPRHATGRPKIELREKRGRRTIGVE